MRCFHYAALAAVAVVGFASVASAADMPTKAPIYKAPVAVPYSWTRFTSAATLGTVGGMASSLITKPPLQFRNRRS